MKFTHHNLGYRFGGEMAVITLTTHPAFVRLMDTINYRRYRIVRKHKFYGGLVQASSIRFLIPHSGHWHITVDLGGKVDAIKSSVRIFPQSVSPFNEAPLPSLPTLIRTINPDKGLDGVSGPLYDIFVVCTTEDKENIGIPLANALKNHRLSIMLDTFSEKVGDNLKQRVEKGVANSRLAVLVLSKDFLKKGWTKDELDNLVTKSATGEQVILAIWHDLSRDNINKLSTLLAHKLARSTAVHDVEEIAAEISESVKYSKIQESRTINRLNVPNSYKLHLLPPLPLQSQFFYHPS